MWQWLVSFLNSPEGFGRAEVSSSGGTPKGQTNFVLQDIFRHFKKDSIFVKQIANLGVKSEKLSHGSIANG